MKRSPLPISIVVLCAIACGSKTRGPAGIVEATEADLADCAFLQKVNGTASDTDSHAQSHAKNNALKQAASIGATHIRWIVPCCTYVEADAYRCDVPD